MSQCQILQDCSVLLKLKWLNHSLENLILELRIKFWRQFLIEKFISNESVRWWKVGLAD